ELVDVSFIAPPASDVHAIEARPSYMIKVAKANLVLKVGLELDLWIDPIIDGSRNGHLTVVDCSKYVQPLEVPSFKADARYGDLHRFGNPHFWLSPQNAKPITDAIIEALAKVDPEHSELFSTNRYQLLQEINSEIERLQPKLAQLKGTPIVFYHNSWPYFDAFAGTQASAFVEPFPGVAPSPTQIKKLIDLITANKIKVIAMEPYFDKRVPEKIAAETGAKVVTLFPSIGGRNKEETYGQWLESNIDAILGAIR
ncbi:MAG TPA: metal ABC transporter substrate-binding protein, partial [candidate division Zixibacteria bacterium]|nr:metal ABC transporter substrate-binding protein [candidate division Zixibacteria bacterium]